MKSAVYAGSFDPVTLGHLDIIRRSSEIFDEVIVGVLVNSAISFSGLLVDIAREMGTNVIVRGLRAVTDFEYELQIAQSNRIVAPDVDTVFLTTNIEFSYLSSSIVKEYAAYGEDVSRFVPPCVVPMLQEKIKTK